MRYIILKEVIPSMKNTPDYNEDMCFITLNYITFVFYNILL